jgi:2-polyprenyl-3-methyl-5-hydroxy-6-metoxy-1,4-benzoquinol methylase
MKVKRVHDDLYLQEKRYEKTKESFHKLINILKKKKLLNPKILDVGCANGELIYNLNKQLKYSRITGYDIHSKLLSVCKKKFYKKNFIFKKVNINSNKVPEDKFDIIIISGVISIFDDCSQVFNNLIKVLKKGGRIYIFNHFNKYPIEVFIKYQTHDTNSSYLQSGWNIHSIEKINNFFKKKGFKLKTYKFQKTIPIKRNKKDPLRSWTFKNSFGKNVITNGLSIIQDQYWLELY